MSRTPAPKRRPTIRELRRRVRRVYPNAYCGFSVMTNWTIWSDRTLPCCERLNQTTTAFSAYVAWKSAALAMRRKNGN